MLNNTVASAALNATAPVADLAAARAAGDTTSLSSLYSMPSLSATVLAALNRSMNRLR